MTKINLYLQNNILFKIKENVILLILIVTLFSIDRFLKLKIINQYNENTIFFNDLINIDLVWNTGIGFGLFSSNTELFYNIISIMIFLVILYILYLATKSKLYDKTMYAIITGGALGNFYDRITYKAVPDFIDFHYGSFHWFTFNFADIFITIGIIFLLTKNLFVKNA